jgi:hypothetical protein
VTKATDLAAQLDKASRRLAVVEETARELHKAVELNIDVAEVARLGRQLDAATSDWASAAAFLDPGPVASAFATCNGVAFSLAGHAKAAVGFSAMANRGAWKSRWDNVWSEWLRAMQWRDRVLATSGLRLAHRVESDQDVERTGTEWTGGDAAPAE